MPFNDCQFDKAMLWLSSRHGPLTQYDMVKLHIMTDVFHVLAHGRPVIGGSLERWKNGAVVRPAYGRLRRLIVHYEMGKETGDFLVAPTNGNAYTFQPKPETVVDADDFSQSELDAMECAWQAIGGMNWNRSQQYMHDPSSFMGVAWTAAGQENSPIDWISIIDAFDRQHRTDHSHIKSLISLR